MNFKINLEGEELNKTYNKIVINVIQQAIADLASNDPTHESYKKDALEWFKSGRGEFLTSSANCLFAKVAPEIIKIYEKGGIKKIIKKSI